MIATKHISCC